MINEEAIFAAAAALPAEDRAAFLESACARQPEMRARIEALLRSHDASGFMDQPTGAALQRLRAEAKTRRLPARHAKGSMGNVVPQSSASYETPSNESIEEKRSPGDQPTTSIGKYRIIQALPGGGQAAPILVHDPDVDRRVVLKRYHCPGRESETYLRLEARALAKVRSPYVAHCLAVETIEGEIYLVMEYVPGTRLNEYAKQECLSFDRITQLIAEIAAGLLDIHSAGVLHRDIKPANILVRRNGTPCLVDFGLALPLGTERPDELVGTLRYMSPEQARQDTLQPCSDVFGLGAVMYELLTGSPPYTGAQSDILDKALRADYPPPRDLNPDIPENLESICLKAMSPDSRHRFATADTFRSALLEHLARKQTPQLTRTPESPKLAGDAAPRALGPNPYQGLAAFTETDSERFFGREVLIDRLWKALADLHMPESIKGRVPRLLPILGPSGSGKSSLARAGLIAKLTRHPLPNQATARFCVLTPAARPLETLATELARLATGDAVPAAKAAEFEQLLRKQESSGACDGLRRILDLFPTVASAPWVLLVDQFEEIFSLCPDESDRRLFIDNLLGACADSSGRCAVVITLRSDFLAETQDHPSLNQIICERGVIVPAMSDDELKAAIGEPARRAGHPLDEATVDLLLADARGHEGALPLLQFALTRIWEGLRAGRSPTATLHEIGGVGGALAGEAQRIFDALTETERRIARRAFLAMIQLGEGTRDTRRRARLDSVTSAGTEIAQVHHVVSRFAAAGARLVTLAADRLAASGEAADVMEVTHEALFDNWQTLREWLDRSRDDIRLQRRIEEAARRWEDLNRPPGLLWRPPDLDLAHGLFARNAEDFSKCAREFHLHSRQQHLRDRRRRRVLFYAIEVAAVVMLILTVGTGWLYTRSERALREADAQGRIARSQEVSLRASELQRLNPAQALQLVGQAFNETLLNRQQPPNATVETLKRITKDIDDATARFTLSEIGRPLVSSANADGTWLVHHSPDLQIHLWDRQGQRVILHGHSGGVRQFAMAGAWLVTLGVESDVLLWDLKRSDPSTHPRLLAPKALGVQSIQVSPHGRWLLGRTGDQGFRLWDLHAPQQDVAVTTIANLSSLPERVLFDPSERWLAFAERPFDLNLWSLTPVPHPVQLTTEQDSQKTGPRPWVPSPSDSWDTQSVNWQTNLHISFSEDGRWLAFSFESDLNSLRYYRPTTSAELRYGVVKIWDLQQQPGSLDSTQPQTTEPTTKRGLPPVHSMTIRRKPQSPEIAVAKILRATHSPDRLITFDGTDAELWKVDAKGLTRELQLPSEAPIATSPNGRWLATHNGEAVRLWDLHDDKIGSANGRKKIVLEALERPSADVQFTSGDRWFVTRSVRGNVRLWDLKEEPQITSYDLNLYDFPAERIDLSPDGRWLIVRSKGLLRLWDLRTTPRRVDDIPQHAAPVGSVLFLNDGTIVSADAWTLHRFDPASGDAPDLLRSDPESLPPLALSNDARGFVAAEGVSLVRWFLPGSAQSHPIRQDFQLDSRILALRFSADSRWLAAGCTSGAVYLWDDGGSSRQGNRKLTGHDGPITQIQFTPDAKRLVTMGGDGSVRVWSLAQPEIEPAVLAGHPGAAYSLAISPDSSLLVTRGSDETSRLWSLNGNADWAGTAWSGGKERDRSRFTFERTTWPTFAADNEAGKIWNAGLDRMTTHTEFEVRTRFHPMMARGPSAATKLQTQAEDRDAKRLVAAGFKSSWFPDGKRLAYGSLAQAAELVGSRPDGPGYAPDAVNLLTGGGIKVLDTTTGDLSTVSERGKDPAVSPDGKWIACVDALRFADYSSETIWLMNSKGGDVRKIAHGTFPSWSTDSTAIFYFSRSKNAVCRLPIEHPDKETVFFASPAREYCGVSPDELMIAYGDRDGVFKVVDVQTRKPLHSFWLPQNGYLPAWAPGTADLVAFGGYNASTAGLHVYDLSTRKLAKVIGGAHTLPAWSADRSALAFDHRPSDDIESSIWLLGREEIEKAPSTEPGSFLPRDGWLNLGSTYRSMSVTGSRNQTPRDWISINYDDSSWPSGQCAALSLDVPEPERQQMPGAVRHCLFRLRFDAPAHAGWRRPLLTLRAPGSVRVFLNGHRQVELGTARNGPNQWCVYQWIDPAHLLEGPNQLGVEVISASFGDPLKLFDVSVTNEGEKVLARIVQDKANPSAVREAALNTFAQLTNSREVVSVLRDLLLDNEAVIRRAAIRSLALSEVDTDATLDLLLKTLLDSNQASLHGTVVEVLGNLGPRAKPAFSHIERFLGSRAARLDSQVASSAWVALLQIAPQDALNAPLPTGVILDGARRLHRDSWKIVVQPGLVRQEYEWAKQAVEASMKLVERMKERSSMEASMLPSEIVEETRRSLDVPDLQTVLGVAQYRLQLFREAATSFEKAHDKGGGDPADLFAWGMVLERLGDKPQAQRKVMVAMELMSSSKWRVVEYARKLQDEAEEVLGMVPSGSEPQGASAKSPP